MGAFPKQGTPLFLAPCSEHQFDRRAHDEIVSILCISSDDAILRLSCVLYYSTVEKVETFLGASPGDVNIYRMETTKLS